jgi:hypothetical protein
MWTYGKKLLDMNGIPIEAIGNKSYLAELVKASDFS